LRVSDLAVCRVNLSSVDFVCQLGDSINENQKLRVLVSGTSVQGKPLAVVLKIDSDGLISQEVVDFNLPARQVFSDGDLLYSQVDSNLVVFKVVINSDDSTSFEKVATVNLQYNEQLYGYEVGVAKVRSVNGSRSIKFQPTAQLLKSSSSQDKSSSTQEA